jgi:hypothetical protein
MACYIKTIYGVLRTHDEVIWFWISCWEDLDHIETRDEPIELPLAA